MALLGFDWKPAWVLGRSGSRVFFKASLAIGYRETMANGRSFAVMPASGGGAWFVLGAGWGFEPQIYAGQESYTGGVGSTLRFGHVIRGLASLIARIDVLRVEESDGKV